MITPVLTYLSSGLLGFGTAAVVGMFTIGVTGVLIASIHAAATVAHYGWLPVLDALDSLNGHPGIEMFMLLFFFTPALFATLPLWWHRVRLNVELWADEPPLIPLYWAPVGWFIPVVNLVLPWQILWQVARLTTPARGLRALIALAGTLTCASGFALIRFIVAPWEGPWPIFILAPLLPAGILTMVVVVWLGHAQDVRYMAWWHEKYGEAWVRDQAMLARERARVIRRSTHRSLVREHRRSSITDERSFGE